MALYHFTLVQQRRKDRASLWFGFAALAYATMVFYGSQIGFRLGRVRYRYLDRLSLQDYQYCWIGPCGGLRQPLSAIFRLLLLERVMRALTWFAIGTGGVILILGLPVFEHFSLRLGLRRLGSANFSGGRYCEVQVSSENVLRC